MSILWLWKDNNDAGCFFYFLALSFLARVYLRSTSLSSMGIGVRYGSC